MITKCTINDVRSIAELWETCFTDNKEIISNYLNNCFPNSETFGYIINSKIVSCITLIPCYYHMDNQIVYGKYLFGVCTDPNYRGKNLSKQIFDYYLTKFSEKDDYIFTHPAEESLYKIYKKWGFNTELYSTNQEISKLLLEEAIVSNPSNTAKEYHTSDKSPYQESRKRNNPSYFLQTLEDFNKHDIDQILSKIQKIRSENKKVFQFSNEILLFFLRDLLLNNNHIYISDKNYAFYSTSQSIINIIEIHPAINSQLNRITLKENTKDAQINSHKDNTEEANRNTLIKTHQDISSNRTTYIKADKESSSESDTISNIESNNKPSLQLNIESNFDSNKSTITESNTPSASSKHTIISAKTCVNGLIYAKNPQLDKSLLPNITLTGE